MIKSLKEILVLIGLCIFVIACKKEDATEKLKFGFLTVSNQTTFKDIDLKRDNLSLTKGTNGLTDIKVPVGNGKLSFFDGAGQLIVDTIYNAGENKRSNWILFQPLATIKPVILENNQSQEAKPQDGFIKVKAANLTQNIFNSPVDIVFYFLSPTTGKAVPADTLENVPMGFDKYVTLNRLSVANKSGSLFILDSKTKQRLHTRAISFNSGGDHSIYTLYIVEDKEFGTAITGGTSKVSIKVLFAN